MERPLRSAHTLFVANFKKEHKTDCMSEADALSAQNMLRMKELRGACLPEGVVSFMDSSG